MIGAVWVPLLLSQKRNEGMEWNFYSGRTSAAQARNSAGKIVLRFSVGRAGVARSNSLNWGGRLSSDGRKAGYLRGNPSQQVVSSVRLRRRSKI